MDLIKLSEIAKELGVSAQTVRNYFHALPGEQKQKNGNSFAVDAETRLLIIQRIQERTQNQSKTFAKLLQSDSNEVLAYFERVIEKKDAQILDLQKQVGLLEAKAALPAPEESGAIRLTWKERFSGVARR